MMHHLVDLERKALSLQNAGKFAEAADIFAEIVREQPDWEHGTGFYNLATCYEDSGQIEKAERAYQSALRYQPAYDVFLGGYASFLYLHGAPERAFKVHLELLETGRINRDDAGVARTLIALRALGMKMGLAEKDIEKRIEIGVFGDAQ